MEEAGGEGVGAGEEGHADGFVVGDALEGADEVGAFEVLFGEGMLVRVEEAVGVFGIRMGITDF